MDPQIAFDEFRLCLAEGRTDDASEHAVDLLEWLDRGGFEPRDFPEHGRAWLEASRPDMYN